MSLKDLTKDKLIETLPDSLYEELLDKVKEKEFGSRQEYVMVIYRIYLNDFPKLFKREFFDEYFEEDSGYVYKTKYDSDYDQLYEDNEISYSELVGEILITGMYILNI